MYGGASPAGPPAATGRRQTSKSPTTEGRETIEPETKTRHDPDQDASGVRSQPEERALKLWVVLARAYSTFARAMAGKVAEFDLTLSQFGVLEALHHLGPLSLGDLADKLLVTGGNITYVMDRLEEQGLVERERSEEDRRVVRAKLTGEGRELIATTFSEHTRYVRELVDVLEPEEVRELRRLLKKLGKGVSGLLD